MRSPQSSRSLVRTKAITNDRFLAPNAIVSSMVSPLTHMEGAAEHRSASVSEHDVDDDNGDELARTRRRHSQGISYDHPGLARSGTNMRSRAPLPRTRLCGTASMEPIMQGWFDTIRPQCERVRLVLCARWLSPEPTDHVRYRSCADGTVRPPQPSTGPGAWTLLTGALRRVSGVVSSQCVCGPTSKVAQARPREAPRVPARYTLCVRTRRKAAHGQGKLPRAKRQKRCKRASV